MKYFKQKDGTHWIFVDGKYDRVEKGYWKQTLTEEEFLKLYPDTKIKK